MAPRLAEAPCVHPTSHPSSRPPTSPPRVPQYVSTAVDYAWFFGTAAVLLSLPVLMEVQRETTIMMLQKQREMEMAQMQEQARQQHASLVDQIKGFGQIMGGGKPGQ